jgi:hypothetical protein
MSVKGLLVGARSVGLPLPLPQFLSLPLSFFLFSLDLFLLLYSVLLPQADSILSRSLSLSLSERRIKGSHVAVNYLYLLEPALSRRSDLITILLTSYVFVCMHACMLPFLFFLDSLLFFFFFRSHLL